MRVLGPAAQSGEDASIVGLLGRARLCHIF